MALDMIEGTGSSLALVCAMKGYAFGQGWSASCRGHVSSPIAMPA
jgi:hypothetical protein